MYYAGIDGFKGTWLWLLRKTIRRNKPIDVSPWKKHIGLKGLKE